MISLSRSPRLGRRLKRSLYADLRRKSKTDFTWDKSRFTYNSAGQPRFASSDNATCAFVRALSWSAFRALCERYSDSATVHRCFVQVDHRKILVQINLEGSGRIQWAFQDDLFDSCNFLTPCCSRALFRSPVGGHHESRCHGCGSKWDNSGALADGVWHSSAVSLETSLGSVPKYIEAGLLELGSDPMLAVIQSVELNSVVEIFASAFNALQIPEKRKPTDEVV